MRNQAVSIPGSLPHAKRPSAWTAQACAAVVLAGLTLFGIIRRTLTLPSLKGRFDAKAATAIAFCASLLWLLHPLQTQAVTYVVQRTESLMGLFYLLTLYCLIRSGSPPWPGRWRAAAIACCLLGMASKEVMVSAPLIVLLYDRTFFTGSFGKTLRRPMWGFAGSWFFLVLAPTSSIMPIRDLAFEHRMYLPLAAVIVPATVVAYLLVGPPTRRTAETGAATGRARGVIALALVVAIGRTLGVLTFLRNRDYRSAITIWKDTTEKRKDNARAWTNLGDGYLKAGNDDEAIRCLTRAIELKPRWSLHYSIRATACLRLRRSDEAMRDCDRVIAMEPTLAKAWCTRGSIHFQTHRFTQAIRDFTTAIELKPDFAEAYNGRGRALSEAGRWRRSLISTRRLS
jgi:tetratricopeptide (TPR) repeat protein